MKKNSLMLILGKKKTNTPLKLHLMVEKNYFDSSNIFMKSEATKTCSKHDVL